MLPCGVDAAGVRTDSWDGHQGQVRPAGEIRRLPGSADLCQGPPERCRRLPVLLRTSPPRSSLATATSRLSSRPRSVRVAGLLGYVPTVDKDALISAATVLTAAPVKREHFGIIYVEAMAAGTVPVAYSGGGVDSIVTNDCGVLTERTPRALGNAIRSMLLDDWRRAQMAAAGQSRARSEFGKGKIGNRFVKFAESLARTNDASVG